MTARSLDPSKPRSPCGCIKGFKHYASCPAGKGPRPRTCGCQQLGRHKKTCKNPKYSASATRRAEQNKRHLAAWRAKNPNYHKQPRVREWHSRHYFLKRYGITHEQLEAMEQAQGGRCAACQRIPSQEKRGGRWSRQRYVLKESGLVLDHCHATNKLRGLLCHSCNVALGLLMNSPERIAALLAYIKETKAS